MENSYEKWLVIYEDETTEVHEAKTISDVIFECSYDGSIHSIIKL